MSKDLMEQSTLAADLPFKSCGYFLSQLKALGPDLELAEKLLCSHPCVVHQYVQNWIELSHNPELMEFAASLKKKSE
jgi:hypothetical protein